MKDHETAAGLACAAVVDHEPEHLTTRVHRSISDAENELFLSHASLCEISNKAAFHRLPFIGTSIGPTLVRAAEMGVILLPVGAADILAAAALPLLHADPFDCVLIAQAKANGLTLVTKDERIRKYDVPMMWQ